MPAAAVPGPQLGVGELAPLLPLPYVLLAGRLGVVLPAVGEVLGDQIADLGQLNRLLLQLLRGAAPRLGRRLGSSPASCARCSASRSSCSCTRWS